MIVYNHCRDKEINELVKKEKFVGITIGNGLHVVVLVSMSSVVMQSPKYAKMADPNCRH